ncbi:MAG: hypothetical protein ACT4PV_01685 [Planctomycetaceae bacterium]
MALILPCPSCGAPADASAQRPGARFPCAHCGKVIAVPASGPAVRAGRRRALAVVGLLVAAGGLYALLPRDRTPEAPAQDRATATLDRETWWTRATARPSGAERLLAPRELRAVLAEGERRGFSADATWWAERRRWAFERILSMDPLDTEANTAAGRRVLQTYPGFRELWDRMLAARTLHETTETLLGLYDDRVQADEAIFLDEEEWARTSALLKDAAEHLRRMGEDPAYRALQRALQMVRSDGALQEYAFVRMQAGPFLVFYTARDLRRIRGEGEEAENARIAGRAAIYEKALAARAAIYTGLLDDLRALYPEILAAHPIAPGDLFFQWIFADEATYLDFCERTGSRGQVRAYRAGHLRKRDGWAFLFEPAEERPEASDPVGESAAYLGCLQLLTHWSIDPAVPGTRHIDSSRALWIQEGWASLLASRRVAKSELGASLRQANLAGRALPSIQRIVDRESWHELEQYREPVEETAEGPPPLTVRESFADLAWVLTEVLHGGNYRPGFSRFLLAQIEGRRGGEDSFEACFLAGGRGGWAVLDGLVHQRVASLGPGR